MDPNETRPYHRQEGESNLWYDRFHRFMRMGPGRSLTRCYREVINAQRAVQGRPLLPKTAGCSRVWRQRAREYHWHERAEAWDEERRHQDLKQVEHALSSARALAPEAIMILMQIMRGGLKNPEGTITEGQNCTQRRLAAERLLNLAGILHLAADDQDFGPQINTVRIIDPRSEEGRQHEAEVRRRVNPNYDPDDRWWERRPWETGEWDPPKA
jgi:hypothetical protein